jgi:indolepyruvate ferredoxin oxidoreductase
VEKLLTGAGGAQVIEFKKRETLDSLIARRVEFLTGYQDAAYAETYKAFVAQVQQAESVLGKTALSEAVARYLFKLMAYKDEYEVARLLTQDTFAQRVAASFDGQVRLRYNLQPPLARTLGLRGKVALGPWFTPVLRGLAKLRFVRGTPLDLFGHLPVRREEKALIGWYRDLVEQVLQQLSLANWETAVELLSLPDGIRGYEDLKTRAIAEARARAGELLTQLSGAPKQGAARRLAASPDNSVIDSR